MLSFTPALYQGGKGAEVFNTSVSACTQEDIVDGMTQQFFTGFKPHIAERLQEASLSRLWYGVEHWHTFGDADTHAGIGAVGDTRLDVGSIEGEFLVEYGIIPTLQRLPVSHGLVPFLTLRGILPTFYIIKGNLIGSHKAAAGTHLYGEIAERQTAFHRHFTHHVTAIFHEIACGTTGSKLRHQIQSHILGRDTLLQFAVDVDTHRLGLLLQNAL